MTANAPLQAADDAAARIRDQVIPKIKDRFAKVPKPHSRVSIGRLAALSDNEALELLEGEIERHGQAAVERRVTEQLRQELSGRRRV